MMEDSSLNNITSMLHTRLGSLGCCRTVVLVDMVVVVCCHLAVGEAVLQVVVVEVHYQVQAVEHRIHPSNRRQKEWNVVSIMNIPSGTVRIVIVLHAIPFVVASALPVL